MIGYATLGVSDMERAKEFYMALLSDKGARLLFDGGRIAFIGESMDKPMVAVCIPYDEQAQHPGNGNMLAFPAESKEAAAALHAKALSLGGTDEGEPGQRMPDMFYGAYVRDPDGNKLVFYVFG